MIFNFQLKYKRLDFINSYHKLKSNYQALFNLKKYQLSRIYKVIKNVNSSSDSKIKFNFLEKIKIPLHEPKSDMLKIYKINNLPKKFKLKIIHTILDSIVNLKLLRFSILKEYHCIKNKFNSIIHIQKKNYTKVLKLKTKFSKAKTKFSIFNNSFFKKIRKKTKKKIRKNSRKKKKINNLYNRKLCIYQNRWLFYFLRRIYSYFSTNLYFFEKFGVLTKTCKFINNFSLLKILKVFMKPFVTKNLIKFKKSKLLLNFNYNSFTRFIAYKNKFISVLLNMILNPHKTFMRYFPKINYKQYKKILSKASKHINVCYKPYVSLTISGWWRDNGEYVKPMHTDYWERRKDIIRMRFLVARTRKKNILKKYLYYELMHYATDCFYLAYDDIYELQSYSYAMVNHQYYNMYTYLLKKFNITYRNKQKRFIYFFALGETKLEFLTENYLYRNWLSFFYKINKKIINFFYNFNLLKVYNIHYIFRKMIFFKIFNIYLNYIILFIFNKFQYLRNNLSYFSNIEIYYDLVKFGDHKKMFLTINPKNLSKTIKLRYKKGLK